MRVRLLFATLGVCGAATSTALSTVHYRGSVYKGNLFIRHSALKYEKKVSKKSKSNITSSRGENSHKHNNPGANLVSTLESPIVGVPIGVPVYVAQDGEEQAEDKGGMNFLSPISGNRKTVTLSLRKETGQRHFKCTQLNNLLCMQFLPDISNAYLRYILEHFNANDLPVKENVLFHLTLRYLRERNTNPVGGKINEGDSQLINNIEDNAYKFIADHARIIKKCAKRRKQKDVDFLPCRTEEDRREQRNFSPTPSQNKIIDAYLKMKKKFNIVFVSIKSERNIYRVFRKIKRNISFYDFMDRLAILCFFHRHAQHRFLLHFFKKYIFHLNNENNLFIINFINALEERTFLKKYILIPHLTYHSILHTPHGYCTCGDIFKWTFLPLNTCNYVETYMKEKLFIGGSNSRGGPKEEVAFLIYANLLDSLTQKRNYYFPELFLKQFCLYYSEKKKYIPHDEKWHYFLITVSSLMKAYYMKRKFYVSHPHGGADHPLVNRVTIHDDDIFRDKAHSLATCGGNRLNSQLVNYLQGEIHGGKIHGGGTLKQYSLLLLLQYIFLLDLNLEHVNLVSRNSANHFSNWMDNNESPRERMTEEDSGTKSTFLKKHATLPSQREKLLLQIILLYKSILSSHCNHTGETILLYNYTFQDITEFVENYLTDLVEKSYHGGREVPEEMKMCVKHILPLCRINPRLLFMLLGAIKESRNTHLWKHLRLGNQHALRNLQQWVKEAIAREFLQVDAQGGVYDRKSTKRGDPTLSRVISAYEAVHKIYKEITSCYDKANIKKLTKDLLSEGNGTKEESSPLDIFKRPILALNLKQIFFLFVILNYFNLHAEIIHLFRHIMGSAAFRKFFCRAVQKKGHHPSVGNQPIVENQCIDQVEYWMCQKILYIYCNSSFSVDNCLRLPAGVTWSRQIMKHVLFYRDPLYIFNHLIGKYGRAATVGENMDSATREGTSNEDLPNDHLHNDHLHNEGEDSVEKILQKVEKSKFFHESTLSKFRSSPIFKQFFEGKIYTRVSQKEYTLIFYALMIYIYKHGLTGRSDLDGNRTKKSENNPAELLPQEEFIYLHFYFAWQSYLKLHRMSKINFLIGAKTFLLVNDVERFQSLLCTNKRMVTKYAILLNSLLNNYIHNYDDQMNIMQNIIIAPTDMYITYQGELIIFNLNYEQLVRRIRPFGEYSNQCKVTLFIDYRKLYPDIINLKFFLTIPFLQSQKVKTFLKENKINLHEQFFWDITDLVIFYGKCLDKKNKIGDFFSQQMTNFSIQENKLVKDAFIISRKR
ncbi:conserved Plasmodium protein, unknown function [Plasmodium knowlesi strain H]|uniref:Heptatricopeptide repeat-containing protein n=3 Tax=Plasmodium knowlesi TaxID=5850 RepID=A0A5K1V4W5_PLAKH|nr:conserved Plasmodium protein, unknown function [Plasmodium knowlesi strain H]OTN64530.1 Uncharacterized protein PKNOH_S130200100 [Plasmodium knowlesi]CAA9989161.1 conserved Plasmodium protein, unknown function [Plasmodium knowlesi strain H]SBO27380.1 conserved Plasmodium protein, unknown function [Plasmodium knowlesi strain H]SBO27508.1 conserved Plasmodium protein, unknown function [Plasmodium knowlesi strain H]VVS78635.1 conserved Plasmodium protein, unknown function [Plasmodium knowlesi |eukprot:XP_002261508.1 hypothetical protein, conserved in Plasmodium species [Plasmodium knowlesi strain H]